MIGLHRLREVDPPAIVVHFSAVAALFCIPMFFLFDPDPGSHATLTGARVLALMAVGLTATVGQVFLTMAFAGGMPAKVSLVGLTQVAFAMIADALLWNRSFSLLTAIGIALVLAPTAWLLIRRG